VVKMEDLRREIDKTDGVKVLLWHRQSGNLLLDATAEACKTLEKDIGCALDRLFRQAPSVPSTKDQVKAFVRTEDEVRSILSLNPFKRKPSHDKVKWCVSFLSNEPSRRNLTLPITHSKAAGYVKLFCVAGKQAYSLWRRKDGTFGLPNWVVERELRVDATTRSWATVEGMIKKIDRKSD
jgi:uncharacterized protein (DUF1697 family)